MSVHKLPSATVMEDQLDSPRSCNAGVLILFLKNFAFNLIQICQKFLVRDNKNLFVFRVSLYFKMIASLARMSAKHLF